MQKYAITRELRTFFTLFKSKITFQYYYLRVFNLI